MITDKMRVVTAKDFFFAAVERGRVYSANIVNQMKKIIKHVLESEYFYLEKKLMQLFV